jgi:signal transduction histidine kinase/ActR/RegA family two-component response regulator
MSIRSVSSATATLLTGAAIVLVGLGVAFYYGVSALDEARVTLRQASLAVAERADLRQALAEAEASLRVIAIAAAMLVLLAAGVGVALVSSLLIDRKRLRLLADSVPGLVSYIDPQMRYRFVNRCYRDWFGVDPQTFLGKTPLEVAGPAAFATFEPFLKRGLAGEVVTYETEVPFQHGGPRAIRGHLVPDLAPNGRARGLFSLTIDIGLERAELSVRDTAHAVALEESRAKSRFLATASHDLRQPLHALTLFLSALERRVAGDETRSIVASMKASVRSMQDMFRTLLDISKIDAGVLVPTPQDFRVGELVERLAIEFTGAAVAKGVMVRAVPTSLRTRTDPVLLESILRNLMSNAVKFTRSGSILIGTRRRGERLRVEVHDTGPGIPEDKRELIFEEFQRAGEKSAEGLGLGLAIVQRLARLIGAPVSLRSSVGRGSCFAIELPVAAARPAGTEALVQVSPLAPIAGRRILIVDDNASIAEAMAHELRDRGCAVVLAADASEALARFAGSLKPEVGVLDYDLGRGLNGVELAEALGRANGGRFPVVLVTGSTDPDILASLSRAGLPWLTKPVEPQALARAIADLIAGAASKTEAGDPRT